MTSYSKEKKIGMGTAKIVKGKLSFLKFDINTNEELVSEHVISKIVK